MNATLVTHWSSSFKGKLQETQGPNASAPKTCDTSELSDVSMEIRDTGSKIHFQHRQRCNKEVVEN